MNGRLSYLNKKEKKVVIAFIKELRKKLRNNIILIKLFGSKVRGDFDEYSDIDIFILVKNRKELRDKISDIAADYLYEYNVLISPVVYTLFEYKKNKELDSFFIEQVEKEGIPL